MRLFSWWAISAGLVIEYLFIRRLFGLAPARALKGDLLANAFSAVAGLVLIPLGGIAWEIFPAFAYNWLLGWGTFNPLTWAGTFSLACAINAVLEGLVYRHAFGVDIRLGDRRFWWLVLANGFSVGAALASLWICPLDP